MSASGVKIPDTAFSVTQKTAESEPNYSRLTGNSGKAGESARTAENPQDVFIRDSEFRQ
jgi:hypothetical protein